MILQWYSSSDLSFGAVNIEINFNTPYKPAKYYYLQILKTQADEKAPVYYRNYPGITK